LTTKDQKTNSRENHENHPGTTTTTPKGHSTSTQTDPGSYSWKLLLIKDARVHYVVLKQQPRTTHPTHTTPEKGSNHAIGAARKPETQVPGSPPVLLPQDPTVCQTLPNDSYQRTFQDAHPPKGTKCPYLPPACAARHLFVDIPPVSTRRRTSVCATGIYS